MEPIDFVLFGVTCIACTLAGYLFGKEEERQKKETIRLYEVTYDDGYSIVIKATKRPTCAEAQKFTCGDSKALAVTAVDDITEAEAQKFFDCHNIDNWPIFRG